MPRLSIEISTIPPEGIACDFETDRKALDIDDTDLQTVRPVHISCEFFRVNRDVLVQGTMRSAVRLTCSRCAEEFVLALNLALDAIYLPVHDTSSGRAAELEAGVADVYAYQEPTVDITEMVRDKLFMSIPLQPHCMAECQGLCPSCGVNRNNVQCQCAEVKLGSPFELLQGLRFSSEG